METTADTTKTATDEHLAAKKAEQVSEWEAQAQRASKVADPYASTRRGNREPAPAEPTR